MFMSFYFKGQHVIVRKSEVFYNLQFILLLLFKEILIIAMQFATNMIG